MREIGKIPFEARHAWDDIVSKGMGWMCRMCLMGGMCRVGLMGGMCRMCFIGFVFSYFYAIIIVILS